MDNEADKAKEEGPGEVIWMDDGWIHSGEDSSLAPTKAQSHCGGGGGSGLSLCGEGRGVEGCTYTRVYAAYT